MTLEKEKLLERCKEVEAMTVSSGWDTFPRQEGDTVAFYYSRRSGAAGKCGCLVFLILLAVALLLSGAQIPFLLVVFLIIRAGIYNYRNREKDIPALFNINAATGVVTARFFRKTFQLEDVVSFLCRTSPGSDGDNHRLVAQLADKSEVVIEGGDTLDNTRNLTRVFGYLCDKPIFEIGSDEFRDAPQPLGSIRNVETAELQNTLLRPSNSDSDDKETLLRPAQGAPHEDSSLLLRPEAAPSDGSEGRKASEDE